MHYPSTPFTEKKTTSVNGYTMAYVDHGNGLPIVFQHGNPTSSYLWRNVMPHLAGAGRLIAADLIGMGDSAKLSPSGPDRYTYREHRDFLFALWDQLDLDQVILVLHDWGSALGFDWASQHPDRVAGIAYMEAITLPNDWDDFPSETLPIFQSLRTELGEYMVLEQNAFVEQVLPASMLRTLDENEMAVYRAPYTQPGESRRPTLSWPRQIPIDGDPADVAEIVETYGRWLAQSAVPKLFINADPGAILIGPNRDFCRTWPNQTEVTVRGTHFIQEDSPDDVGEAIADFVARVRGQSR